MTIGIYGLLLALMAVMKLAPHSGAGRLLNRQLVELPLALFARMERHHLIFVLVVAALLMAGTEVLVGLGSVDFALVYALDLSLYIDGLLAAMALASLTRTKSGVTALRLGAASLGARLRRVMGRRRVRTAVPRRDGPPANDDDHPVIAAAA